jgi:hypothetical protein
MGRKPTFGSMSALGGKQAFGGLTPDAHLRPEA